MSAEPRHVSVGEQQCPLSRTKWWPRVVIRSGVRALALRTWSADGKRCELAALRAIKQALPDEPIRKIGGELATFIEALHGRFSGAVSPIACGHSRRPDCLSCRLTAEVASLLDVPFVESFAFRPVAGSSHPRGFRETPPLFLRETRPRIIVIDDVWTSGAHMHEALTALRAAGSDASGIVWLAS